jgi:hypothetical protein
MGGVADFVGDVVGGVGDVIGEAGDFVGDVIETAADNPVKTAATIAAIYYGVPYLAGEAAAAEAAAATFGSSTAAEIAAAEAASAAAYTGGTGLSQTLFGSTPGLTAQAIAEGAVPTATQGYIGAGGSFNPLAGYFGNIIPSTPTDFLTSFIPKTPGEIANTLGLVSVLGGTVIPRPEVPGVNMTIPPSNVPRYGTGQTIFNAYNSAKQSVNDILYPQGLLTTQPRTAGIYSNYLQQQGLI